MGELSIFASRFSINSKSLREFDEALRFLKKQKEVERKIESHKAVVKLLAVIDPIIDSMKENITESTIINDRSVFEIIRNRHNKEWPKYRERIEKLHSKLALKQFSLTKTDFNLLNDIADALESECAHLFRRISEKR